jgi:hypothetical protein
MILGILFILGGTIYLVNPNVFKSINKKWTSPTRDSMLPYQYAKRVRIVSVGTILIGVLFIVKELFLKK